MSNLIIATIRTLVPYAVGLVLALVARVIPLDLPAGTIEGATGELVLLIGSLYYIGVAWLERKFPWFGWLLGVARNPIYEPKHSK
jgi:hypothetical protein